MDVFNLVATLSLDTSKYEKELENAEKKLTGVGSSASGISGTMGAAEGKAKRLGSALATAAKVSAAAIGAASTAVVAFGKQSVSVGKAFDSSMSQVAATMGMSMDDMESEVGSVELAWGTFSGNLREYAKEMGANTAFSATQAAEALNFMALAGYNTQEAMTQLPNVLNLAAAGGMDLARASDMVTDAQSALGIPMEEMTGFVNKLAKTASSSNTSVAQLGEAILTVGGTAKNLVGGTTELSTALGLLADNGIKGAEGGTALRNILLNLTPKSDEAAEAMERIGMNAYDANGNLRPLSDIFLDMNAELSKMTTKERTNVLSSIFNKVDLKSVNALLNTTNERWEELAEGIDASAGAAQKMADTQLDNLSGSMTLFRSALEGAQIAISDKLSPTLNDFVKLGAEGLSKITNVFSKEGLSPAIDALGEWISDDVLPTLLEKIPQVISAGSQLIMSLVKGIIKNLPQVAQAAVKIVTELAGSITKELPVLIPAAVDAIITIADGLIDNISLLIDAAIDLMLGLANGLEKALPKLVKEVPRIVKALVNAFVKAWPQITKAFTELATSDVGAIVTAFAGIKGGIKALKIGGVFDGIKKKIVHSKVAFKDWAWFLSNPVFASVTATVGGLAALFIGLREVREKALQGEYGLTDAQKDAMEAAHNFAESYRETETARQESFASIDAEYKYLDGLKIEFYDLVGSNGEVKKGYEERAEFIKGEFAKVLGLERDEVDKLLKKNEQLGDSIDLLMKKKRAQAIFDASEGAYRESIQKRDEALKNLVDTRSAAQEAQEKLDKYWADHLKEYENAWQMGGYNNEMTQYTKSHIEAEARELEAGVENAKQAAKEAEEAFVGYNSQLKNYEQLAGALSTDNIERITEMADNLKANLITAETGTRATLEAQLQEHEENLANIERMAKNSAYNISKETVAEYRDMRDRAKAELDRFEKDFAENQDVVQAKSKETTEAVGKESKEAVKKVKAPWEGTKQHFEGVWNGIKGAFAGVADWFGTTFGTARQKTESAFGGITDFFSGVWNGITGVFSNAEEVFAGIGNNVQIGFKRGVNQGALPTWMGTQMTDITLGAQRALGERSPSKVFEQIGRYIDEGLVQGIEGGLSMVEDAADNLAETTYDRDFFKGQEVQVSTTAREFEMGDSRSYMEVPRYTAPQFLNLTIDLGGQKVKSVIYQMVQEESQRVGLKLVREVV